MVSCFLVCEFTKSFDNLSKEEENKFFKVKYVETARRGVSVFSIWMYDIREADSPDCSWNFSHVAKWSNKLTDS